LSHSIQRANDAINLSVGVAVYDVYAINRIEASLRATARRNGHYLKVMNGSKTNADQIYFGCSSDAPCSFRVHFSADASGSSWTCSQILPAHSCHATDTPVWQNLAQMLDFFVRVVLNSSSRVLTSFPPQVPITLVGSQVQKPNIAKKKLSLPQLPVSDHLAARFR
jgi:hypothetical protein